MKAPRTQSLGQLGDAKNDSARAKVPSAKRRREMAKAAVKELAITTGEDAPIEVRRLLKSYEPSALRWARSDDRYVIVRAILVRGDDRAQRWLRSVLRRDQVRELVRQYGGAGSSEPERARLRRALRLTLEDIPARPYLGFRWGKSG
jgi:hypothetical protein